MVMYKERNKFCKQNPNIIFTRADKGNTTVPLNKDLYIMKVEELLNDRDNYTKIKHNPAQKIEKDLNKLLKGWLNNELITKKSLFPPTFQRLTPP